MQAKELRIGNIVQNDILDIFNKGYIEVEARHIYEIAVKESAQDYSKYVDHFKPIPLTEEWLLKFGFHYSDDDNEFLEFEIIHKIKLYSDNSNNFSTVILRLKENEIESKYVHQLQNLYFALTGQELTIKTTEL